MHKISFASDNYAGIHPDVVQAIIKANEYYTPAYGDDDYTQQAIEKFSQHFGNDNEVYFVFNGTGANVSALAALSNSYRAIICSDMAHIQNDECGAPEKYLGSKLLLVKTTDGKISIDKLAHQLQRIGDQHHVQPGVISISQTTEYGTVYTPSEVKQLADFAHANNMFLHMDGARISNAAVALNKSLSAITKEVGVDVLSFGGTKNGLMIGEAVIFFNRSLAKDYLYIRKQSMQLASKMRYISAQFIALLTDDLWKRNAQHANAMAKILAEKLSNVPGFKLTKKVEANALFAILPADVIKALQEKFYFYVWNQSLSEVRLMTSFATTEEEINVFVAEVVKLLRI